MQLALSFWFNTDLEQRIRALWQTLEQSGIRSELYDGRYRPHVTVGVWDVADVEPLSAALKARSRSIRSFKVSFGSVGLFPGDEGVVFLAPIVDANLLSTHDEIWNLASRYGTAVSSYYRPNAWVPHATASWKTSSAEAIRASKTCLEYVRFPLHGLVTSLGLIKTPEEVELEKVEFLG